MPANQDLFRDRISCRAHFQRGQAADCSNQLFYSTTRIAEDDLVRTRLPLLRAAAREMETALRRWPALAHSLIYP